VSESSKVGGGGGRGGKLYNLASLAIGDEEDSSLSVSLVLVGKLTCFMGAAVDVGSSRAGSRGGPERVAERSASWHSSEQYKGIGP
jgi:hypothetical protein